MEEQKNSKEIEICDTQTSDNNADLSLEEMLRSWTIRL
jgi:hypothetical protein